METLREYVERGGTFAEFDADELAGIAEHAIGVRRTMLPAERSQFARELPERIEQARRVAAAQGFELAGLADRLAGWVHELDSDDELCDRVAGLLPAELVRGELEYVNAATHPVVLLRDERDEFRCSLTGEVRSGVCFALMASDQASVGELGDVVFSLEALAALVDVEGGAR